MNRVDEMFSQIGFERKETDSGFAYLLDLNPKTQDDTADKNGNDGLLITQESERYVMVTDIDGVTTPSNVEQPIKVALFEFVGEAAYERWAGIYTTADKFINQMHHGYPWVTKPQCYTDGCRKFVERGQIFCPKCKSNLN